MSDDYAERLRRQREQKDHFFAEHPRSPIPVDERSDFDGLAYFPPDEEFRYVVPLHEFDEKESVTVATSTEGEREYLDWGEFRIEVDGEEVSVHAYKHGSDEDGLFVPFRDATSGDETYGAGRYLDLDVDEHRVNDEWILDFNLAYNPYCAYSEAYECPLPPGDNWLQVPIRAGEKAYEP